MGPSVTQEKVVKVKEKERIKVRTEMRVTVKGREACVLSGVIRVRANLAIIANSTIRQRRRAAFQRFGGKAEGFDWDTELLRHFTGHVGWEDSCEALQLCRIGWVLEVLTHPWRGGEPPCQQPDYDARKCAR